MGKSIFLYSLAQPHKHHSAFCNLQVIHFVLLGWKAQKYPERCESISVPCPIWESLCKKSYIHVLNTEKKQHILTTLFLPFILLSNWAFYLHTIFWTKHSPYLLFQLLWPFAFLSEAAYKKGNTTAMLNIWLSSNILHPLPLKRNTCKSTEDLELSLKEFWG